MAELDTGMEKQDMKRLLLKSKKEPVNCAFAQGAEPTVGLLMLDRIKQPKAVEKELLKRFPDARNTRFGTAFVDIDDNPKLAKFLINKPCSGMAKKLVKTLKGTGFTKVVILLEDGTEVEADSEEDEAGIAAAVVPRPLPTPQTDAAALRRTLATLIGRIQTMTDPVRRAALAKLATEANAGLKAESLAGAQAVIAQLGMALEAAASAPASDGAAVTYARARLAWLAARQKVESEIEKLRRGIIAVFEPYGLGAELDAAHTRFCAPVLATLDESLADKLDAATNAADTSTRASLVAEARAIMQRYAAYLAGEPIIVALDVNPFVPLAIRSTLTATLTTLARAVH